jgi:hypothetical protein
MRRNKRYGKERQKESSDEGAEEDEEAKSVTDYGE